MDKTERLKDLFRQTYDGVKRCKLSDDCNGCKVDMLQALNAIEYIVMLDLEKELENEK